ncbi:MAG: hypothetical protein QOH79_2004 [Acidimicrobiaceae bacterium]
MAGHCVKSGGGAAAVGVITCAVGPEPFGLVPCAASVAAALSDEADDASEEVELSDDAVDAAEELELSEDAVDASEELELSEDAAEELELSEDAVDASEELELSELELGCCLAPWARAGTAQAVNQTAVTTPRTLAATVARRRLWLLIVSPASELEKAAEASKS